MNLHAGQAHPSRLNRALSGYVESDTYAKEELIAELASAYCSAQCGFEKSIPNNAAYLQSWVAMLKEDNRAIFKVQGAAMKAHQFLNEKLIEYERNHEAQIQKLNRIRTKSARISQEPERERH